MPKRRRDAGPIEVELPLALPDIARPERSRTPRRRVAAEPAAPDLFDPPARKPEPPPEPAPEPAPAPAPSHLDAGEAQLQSVDPRSFGPQDRSDAWLYWLTDPDSAAQALCDGLPIDPDDPLMLADRQEILPRLAVLAEEPDFSPQGIAILRLRRIAAAAFLEPGPEPSCYRLSGRNVSA